MDWNKTVIVGAQCVLFIGLAVCVSLGHDSAITDAMLAIAGSLAGTGIYSQVKVFKASKPPYDSSEAAQ
jgi:glycopeptide antibiotics resistance protein